MTLVVAVLSIILSLGLGAFIRGLGDASASKAAAQTAADAAALAAVAESAPYGEGEPSRVAETFAASNGAHLVSCWCEPGDTAMQVEVVVDNVVARARAVFDPSLLRPAGVSIDIDNLHPRLARAVQAVIEGARGQVFVESGYRSHEEQAILWSEALRRYGSPEAADDWVARPGTSRHEQGLAVDLGGDVEMAARLAHELGLPIYRPLPNEPWHFELSP